MPSEASNVHNSTLGAAPSLPPILYMGNYFGKLLTSDFLLLLVFNGDLQSAKELLILRSQPDLPSRFKLHRRIGFFESLPIDLIVAIVALVESNCCFEHQK